MSDSAVHARPKARRKPTGRKGPARTRAKPAAKSRLPDTMLDVLANAGAEAVGLALAGARVALERGGPVLLSGATGLGQLVQHLARRREVQRALAGGVLCAALVVGSQAVRDEVRSWPRFRVDRSAFDATPLPPELSRQARADLARLPLPAEPTAFDRGLPALTAACLADLPWVQGVERVELLPPNRLAFALRARRPAAQLGTGEQAPVVTSDGAVIPRLYAARPDGLPRFEGVPGAGEVEARAEALAAGLQVLETLAESSAQVVAVDLSNLRGARDSSASEVVLELAAGLRVDWGRAGGDQPQIDPDAKRAALEAFLRAGPPLEQVECLSLRWDQPTYVLKDG